MRILVVEDTQRFNASQELQQAHEGPGVESAYERQTGQNRLLPRADGARRAWTAEPIVAWLRAKCWPISMHSCAASAPDWRCRWCYDSTRAEPETCLAFWPRWS